MTRKKGMRKSAPVQDSAVAKNILNAIQYRQMFSAMLQQRYVWSGLPPTVSERYLEKKLTQLGCATIAFDAQAPGLWMGLGASGGSVLDAYNDPVEWEAVGENGKANFHVRRWQNGVYVYDRRSREFFWDKYDQIANSMALYARAEDMNLIHQFTPWIISAPEEQALSMENLLARVMSGDPAVFGYESLGEMMRSGIEKFDTGTEWKGAELQSGALGKLAEFYQIAGIPHLHFEKSERLITDETEQTLIPTRMMLEDGLQARRDACEELNVHFGLEVTVDVNPVIKQVFEREEPQQTGGEEDAAE